MKRRLQVLAVCAAALLAVRLMGQDTGAGGNTGNGGGGGGDTSGGSGDQSGTPGADNSGAAGSSNGTGTGGENSNGGAQGGTTPAPGGGAPEQGTGGASPTPAGTSGLFGPGTGTGPGATPPATITPPPPVFPTLPGSIAPIPGMTPPPSVLSTGSNAQNQNGAAALQSAPVTLSLPGGYYGAPAKTFTLGQGRLAKPPITFSATVSQGYDDNIYSADSHPVATPTPIPAPTPPLEERLIGFRITVPYPPTPIFETFRPKASPTPRIAVPQTLGVVGSAVTTAALAIQIQKGTPRTVVILDASVGAQDYWNEGNGTIDYSGNFDMSLVEKLTPRATFSMDLAAVYQKTPNFALLNAPTSAGNGGDYLNGSGHWALSYAWTSRISTVTAYDLNLNILQSNAGSNVYDSAYGTQFRYQVTPRNTITAELRETSSIFPSNAQQNSNGTVYLLGLDSFISARLRNTISGGLEYDTFASGGSQWVPDIEADTTLALPRGAGLSWTNFYGSQPSMSAGTTTTTYRTGLSYSQPLSSKLVASVSIAYNYLTITDSSNSAGSYNQKQFQASLNLGYTVSPHFSLSLSYTYLDLLSTQINSSYTRDQTFLGGSYSFR